MKQKKTYYNTVFVVIVILVSQLASIQIMNNHQNPGSHLLHQLISPYNIEFTFTATDTVQAITTACTSFIFAAFALTAKTLQNKFEGRCVIHLVYENAVYSHPPTMSMWGHVNSCAISQLDS